MRIKKIINIILFNIIFTLFLFLLLISLIFIIEIISGRYLSKNKLDCAYLHCNANYNYKNRSRENTIKGDLSVFYQINYKKDEYGFRGRRKSISDIDILTIGGSTTDEKFLNYKDTWSEQLEEKFKIVGKDIDVVNAGIDGQSSHGHIWSLKNWFPKIKGFKTKYIIFYMGINENLKETSSNKHDLEIENSTIKAKIKFYIQRNNGFLYKIYNIFAKKYYNLFMNQGYNPLYPEYSKILKKEFIPTYKQKSNLKKNLNHIVKLSKKIDAIPIFVTQRTLFWKKENNQILIANNVKTYNKSYYHFEKFVSDTIIEFCAEHNVLCIDVFNNVQFKLDDFFELAHTTHKGSQKIADFIFEKLTKVYNF